MKLGAVQLAFIAGSGVGAALACLAVFASFASPTRQRRRQNPATEVQRRRVAEASPAPTTTAAAAASRSDALDEAYRRICSSVLSTASTRAAFQHALRNNKTLLYLTGDDPNAAAPCERLLLGASSFDEVRRAQATLPLLASKQPARPPRYSP